MDQKQIYAPNSGHSGNKMNQQELNFPEVRKG